jgi:prophage antirepressor-like protein
MENVLPVLAQQNDMRIVEVDGQPVVMARDLARALEYKDQDAVGRLYRRNQESFNGRDTFEVDMRRFTVNLTVNPRGGDPHIRVFTKRGALKICMKSNQPRAVAVQEALLDLYEQVERIGLTPIAITRVLEAAIKEAVTLLGHQQTVSLASSTLKGTILMKVNKSLQIKEAMQDIEMAPDRSELGRRIKKWANFFEVTDKAVKNWRKNYVSYGFTGLFRKEHPGKGIRKSTCEGAADRLKLVYMSAEQPTLKEVYKQVQDEAKSTGPETCSECCYFAQCANPEKASMKIGSYKTAQRIIKEGGGGKILPIRKIGGS